MAQDPPALALKARWVFPVDRPPIVDGVVAIRGQRIVPVDQNDGPVHDLGNVALVPGLINTHTHLEFSDLETPIGQAGMRLPDWIRQVMAQRRASGGTHHGAVARGLAESLAAGTTALGEIATTDWRQPVHSAGGETPGVIMFRESIAPTRDRIEAALTAAEEFLIAPPFLDHVQPGVSPHAPYTVHPELLTALVELSQRRGVPVAMHLAESREELELLQSGSGRLCDVLRDANAWDPRPDARYGRILDYLQVLARGPRALVIHGNYLSQPDLEFLAAHAQHMTIVYCPRTHHYFRHEPYPLAGMLALGASLALGTDSRASNPDLGMLGETQFVARHHPLPGSVVLRLATLDGARALGVADEMGTLTPGKLANFAVIGLDDSQADDPHELLLRPAARVVQTWLRGQRIAGEADG